MSHSFKDNKQRFDNKKVLSVTKEKANSGRESVKPLKSIKKESFRSFRNSPQDLGSNEIVKDLQFSREEDEQGEEVFSSAASINQTDLSYAEQQKLNKEKKILEKDEQLLKRDFWLARNGHTLTYAGIFLFTLVLYFRPYEMFPALSRFNSMALWIAVATLLIYILSQFSLEGSLTNLTTEVKCVLLLGFFSILSVVIARDPSVAWAKFSETYYKIILIFIVMANSLRTKSRLKGLMWLSITVGILTSYEAIKLYQKGEFKIDGVRVVIDMGGMFGNPNDMALHQVIFTPIAILLGIASRNKIIKVIYFAAAAMMVAGNVVTQSRGGFLGLLAVGAVLVWKLGRKNRLNTIIISAVVGVLVIALAPGDYGSRMLTIFYPELDPVHSATQRRELLIQSFWVTLRNPLGVGMGNFRYIAIDNKETHNAFTQVSSELGWFAFTAYMILLISPLRKLHAIERRLFAQKEFSWTYYLSIGIQTSIVAYMVSSFFGAVAYDWFVYYPIAYAVCLRRIHRTEQAAKEIELSIKPNSLVV